ncbi:hypothetical protein D3C73_878780 [compost metagenome]
MFSEVGHFVHLVDHENGRGQLVQVPQHPLDDVVVAFLERVSGVHHIQNQVRLRDVALGQVFVHHLLAVDTLFLVAEQAGGVDDFALFRQPLWGVDGQAVGGLVHVDVHVSHDLAQPSGNHAGLAIGKSTEQGDTQNVGLDRLYRRVYFLQLAADIRAHLAQLVEHCSQLLQPFECGLLLRIELLELFHKACSPVVLWYGSSALSAVR